MTAPAIVTSPASGLGPSCADNTVNNGRNRLPPALNRYVSESVITASALRSSASISCSIRPTPSRTIAANAASAKSMPATTVAGVLTGPNILVSMETRAIGADLVVVGAGPAGSAAAAWAARAGTDVLVIDSASFPRDKPCGDGLTPRAVAELERLGLGDWLDSRIRHRGLRMSGFGGEIQVDWPGPSFPSTGSAVARLELDDRIRKCAEESGARMLLGAKAVTVHHDSSRQVTSLTLADGTQVACRQLIVADGARSSLGRKLGRRWHQETVYGVAARGYLTTPRADDPWLTSHLALRPPDGAVPA